MHNIWAIGAHTVRNLGVIFDSELSIWSRIGKTASAFFFAATTARHSD